MGALQAAARNAALSPAPEAAKAPVAQRHDSARAPEAGHTLPAAILHPASESDMQERQLLGVLDCYQEVQAAGNSDGHAGGLDMQGTACIAWLPDGRFTGAPLIK